MSTNAPLADAAIIAYVLAWNAPPPGQPSEHPLYTRGASGWYYLSHAGQQYWIHHFDEVESYRTLERNRVKQWAEHAAQAVLQDL